MKKFIIFTAFIVSFFSFSLTGQEIKLPRNNEISLGFDVSGLVRKIFQPSFTEGEISLSASFIKRLYFTTEAGLLKITDKKKDFFNYYSNGNFIRFGFDYNFYKKKNNSENNLIFIGLRYGLSSFIHKANQIIITDNLWGDYSPQDLPDTKVKTQWVELIGGIRVEIFKNFSLGWSVRARKQIYSKGINYIKPFMIPGYGKGTATTALGFNYALYYTISL